MLDIIIQRAGFDWYVKYNGKVERADSEQDARQKARKALEELSKQGIQGRIVERIPKWK